MVSWGGGEPRKSCPGSLPGSLPAASHPAPFSGLSSPFAVEGAAGGGPGGGAVEAVSMVSMVSMVPLRMSSSRGLARAS